MKNKGFTIIEVLIIVSTIVAIIGIIYVLISSALKVGAETHVDNSIKNTIPFVRSNVLGTANMLEFARTLDGEGLKEETATITMTLPTAAAGLKYKFVVADAASGSVILNPQSTDTFVGCVYGAGATTFTTGDDLDSPSTTVTGDTVEINVSGSVQEITTNSGVQCVVFDGYNSGGIACNFKN